MATKRVLYAALTGNFFVAATKAVAAVITGSSAMVSEAVHSFVDTGDQLLLLYGLHRSRLPPHEEHPLGHGRELYFWSFVVALLIFALGAGISIYEGILHIHHPTPITDPRVSYIVLGLAFLFEGWSWTVALKEVRRVKGSRGILEEFERSKDPPSFMVLFEDTAALLGIIIAALTTFLSIKLRLPILDGVASILIGLILATIAVALARESKSLLIGEQADPALRKSLLQVAREVSKAEQLELMFAIQLSPEEVIVALAVRFPADMRAREIGAEVLEIERQLRARHHEVVALYVRPQEPAGS